VDKVRAMGLSVPVVAGIMPITDVDQIKRFTTMCGAGSFFSADCTRTGSVGEVRFGIGAGKENCAVRGGAKKITAIKIPNATP
jgi:hypothetical protein